MIKYITVSASDSKGNISEYSVKETFKDTDEMVAWFAHNCAETDYHLRHQWLSAGDTECDFDVFNPVLVPRYSALIEITRKHSDGVWEYRVLDLRNYIDLITKKRQSTDCQSYRQVHMFNRLSKNKQEQGRTHKGGRASYKHSAFYKQSVKSRYTGENTDAVYTDETLVNCDIVCRIPDTNVRRAGRDPWDENWAYTENNWKERKIRHQWQWHKPYAGGKRFRDVYDKIFDKKADWQGCVEDVSYITEDIGA